MEEKEIVTELKKITAINQEILNFLKFGEEKVIETKEINGLLSEEEYRNLGVNFDEILEFILSDSLNYAVDGFYKKDIKVLTVIFYENSNRLEKSIIKEVFVHKPFEIATTNYGKKILMITNRWF